MNYVNKYFQEIRFFFNFVAAWNMKTFKIFQKCDVLDMPEILEDNNFNIIINFVHFKTLKVIKLGIF